MAVKVYVDVDPNFKPMADAEVNDLMAKIADAYMTEVAYRMETSPRSGRVYMSHGKRHRASAPGEPPAPDTHALIDSIGSSAEGEGFKRVVSVGVDSDLGKALSLEFGTSRMAPRPAWIPAVGAVRGQLLQP